MLKDTIKELTKFLVLAEPNHSDKVKEFIIKTIENNN